MTLEEAKLLLEAVFSSIRSAGFDVNPWDDGTVQIYDPIIGRGVTVEGGGKVG